MAARRTAKGQIAKRGEPRKKQGQLEREVDSLLADVDPAVSAHPNQPSSERRKVTLTATMTYSGPMPHPEMLAEYERITPGLADRIVALAERQANHRMMLESKKGSSVMCAGQGPAFTSGQSSRWP